MDVWGMIVHSEVSTCVQQVVMSLVVTNWVCQQLSLSFLLFKSSTSKPFSLAKSIIAHICIAACGCLMMVYSEGSS